MDSASMTTETLSNDGLFAGRPPAISQKVTVAAGADLTRGTVLGKITASGKYVKSVAAAVDGSEDPVAILAQDCAAAAADKEAMIYEDGVFNSTQLVFGAGHTATSTHDALRALGILLAGATAVVNP